MEICINLEFGDGNFESGFDSNKFNVAFITLDEQIARFSAKLHPNTNIPICYKLWKQQYYSLLKNNPQRGFINNQTTHISEKDCHEEVENLREQMRRWLQPLQSKVSSVLRNYPDAEVRLIIYTNNVTSLVTKDILHRLPWHEWDFCTEDLPAQNYTKEAALYFNAQTVKAPVYEDICTTGKKIRRARIISVFGDSEGIDTGADNELLQKLKKKGAELISLVEPSRADFNMLWEEACDILFFAGHSETQNNGQAGFIKINPHDALSLTDIKKTLRTAIAKGLKLAIFNSCDGLGLASELAQLNLGYIIVWREVVPDVIAQKFIEYFLSAFARGKSLFASVGEARDRLLELAEEQDLQKKLPGISWLPVICQNTTEAPPTWSYLGGLTGELPNNPYRGLSAFREEDAAFYFGRTNFVHHLLQTVNKQPLVAVIGASGSSKSSVVFAGLLPLLRSAGNTGIATFRPENKPFDNLAIALSDIAFKSILQRRKVRSKIDANRLAQIDLELDWRKDETKLCEFIQSLISDSGYHRLVLVADQFEELYTQKVNHSESV
jgi:CHAT domain